MDNPKRMENMRTGTKTSTGAVPEIPNSECPHPHENTAFIIPRAAPTDSRFMIDATSGINRLRNTAMSSKKANTTTTPTNRGSFEDKTWEKSVWMAVAPPTRTVKPVPADALGMTSWRSRDNRVEGWDG